MRFRLPWPVVLAVTSAGIVFLGLGVTGQFSGGFPSCQLTSAGAAGGVLAAGDVLAGMGCGFGDGRESSAGDAAAAAADPRTACPDPVARRKHRQNRTTPEIPCNAEYFGGRGVARLRSVYAAT